VRPSLKSFLFLFLLCFILFYFGGTGVLNSGFTLAKQVFYHLSHVFSPVFSAHFRDGDLRTISPGWP
jgi:hypothetical protein